MNDNEESREPAARPGGTAPVPPNVLIVMGVSGSGKSTIAAMLAQRLGWTYQDGDWFHPTANVGKMHAGLPLTDEDRRPWLKAIADWIDGAIDRAEHAVIACSALHRAYRDVLAGDHGDAVRSVYLDGSKELIARRLSLRSGHFMPPTLLDSQFAALEPPAPDEHPITVGIEGHPSEIVDDIVGRLAAETGKHYPRPGSSFPASGDPA